MKLHPYGDLAKKRTVGSRWSGLLLVDHQYGIRKVLGAGPAGIVRLLSRNFMILVGIALVIAAPLACMTMHRWLQDFALKMGVFTGE
jgi:hypothetical protein